MRVSDGSNASLLIRGNAVIRASLQTGGDCEIRPLHCASALKLEAALLQVVFLLTVWWFFECSNLGKINSSSLVHFTSTGLIAVLRAKQMMFSDVCRVPSVNKCLQKGIPTQEPASSREVKNSYLFKMYKSWLFESSHWPNMLSCIFQILIIL